MATARGVCNNVSCVWIILIVRGGKQKLDVYDLFTDVVDKVKCDRTSTTTQEQPQLREFIHPPHD